jgi:signal transduction histidine kinase
MKNKAVFIIILFLSISCAQQEKKLVHSLTQTEKEIIKLYNRVGYVSNICPDSLGIYASRAEQLAANESIAFQAMALYYRGVYYQNSSSYQLSNDHFEKSVKLLENAKHDTIKARNYIGIANNLKNSGDYPKAFRYLYQALRINEKYHRKYGISSSLGCIAQIHLQKNDIPAAKEHLIKALKVLGDDKYNQVYLIASHTLANLYGMSGDYKSALEIDKEGILISDKMNSPRNKSTFFDNKANCFMYSNQLDSAAYYFNECLKIDIAIGETKQVADTYSNLGTLSLFKKDLPTAEHYINKSIAILKEIDQKPNLDEAYDVLIDVYQKQGKLQKAIDIQKAKEANYKQLISEKKEQALAEFKIVYETQKKEQELAENKVLLLQHEAKVKQKNYILIAVTSLALFIGLVGFLIYRQQKIKNQQQEQEFKLKSAIVQIESQNELQEQRLSISRDLHDNIGAQLTFIISSVDNIKYAFDIQNPKLESKLANISHFTKATISELRDTIWAMNYNEISIEELQSRITNFIEKAKDAKESIDFKFKIAEGLSNLKLSAVVGMNCYRTIQEAINNAIKYAEATEVVIEVEKMEDTIQIAIRDNGIGFDIQTVEKGNGLRNIQKRVEDIGGILAITSSYKQGTIVKITLNKTNLGTS